MIGLDNALAVIGHWHYAIMKSSLGCFDFFVLKINPDQFTCTHHYIKAV
jgi:hypothetical protein